MATRRAERYFRHQAVATPADLLRTLSKKDTSASARTSVLQIGCERRVAAARPRFLLAERACHDGELQNSPVRSPEARAPTGRPHGLTHSRVVPAPPRQATRRTPSISA